MSCALFGNYIDIVANGYSFLCSNNNEEMAENCMGVFFSSIGSVYRRNKLCSGFKCRPCVADANGSNARLDMVLGVGFNPDLGLGYGLLH